MWNCVDNAIFLVHYASFEDLNDDKENPSTCNLESDIHTHTSKFEWKPKGKLKLKWKWNTQTWMKMNKIRKVDMTIVTLGF